MKIAIIILLSLSMMCFGSTFLPQTAEQIVNMDNFVPAALGCMFLGIAVMLTIFCVI